jgi:hypothetical protein
MKRLYGFALPLFLSVYLGCAFKPAPVKECLSDLDGDHKPDRISIEPKRKIGGFDYLLKVEYSGGNFGRREFILDVYDNGDSEIWLEDVNDDGYVDLVSLERDSRFYGILGSKWVLKVRNGLFGGAFSADATLIRTFEEKPGKRTIESLIRRELY